MNKSGPLVIIDGHNLFIRNFVVSPMMDSNGNSCGGTIGTIASVRKIINDFSPSNVLIVWDGEGGSQRRKAIYSAYKEGRTVRVNREYDMGESAEENLENIRRQRQNAADYLALLGIPQVRCDGVEADDLMAYIAGKMDHPGGCIIVTTDKDMLQLIRDRGMNWECPNRIEGDTTKYGHAIPIISDKELSEKMRVCCKCHSAEQSEVKVWSPIKKVMYDRTTFISEHGVLPENFRLVKALTGDESDNIEGIRGFGPKTVVKLFPAMADRRLTPNDVMEMAKDAKGVAAGRLREQKQRFEENLSLVDLSEPMLSATAARQARDAMHRDLGCREIDLMLRLRRDGVGLDDRTVQIFRDFVVRRRRALEGVVNLDIGCDSSEGDGVE